MLSSSRREKELAGDARAGWSARMSVRERHRKLVKAEWRALAVFGGAVLIVTGTAAFFATGPLQQGVILGSGVTLAACMVTAVVVLTSGTAPLMMGELAEQWTAQEVRPTGKHGWKLVNHFGLGRGDQDHVLIGPGGVVLVETKWGGTPWDVDGKDPVFRRALEQTARNAKQLGMWHGVAKFDRPAVEPVLAVWGPAARGLVGQPPRRHESGVMVMAGDQLQDWMLRRGRDQLDAAQIAGVFEEMDRHLVRRDEREAVARPMPRSLPGIVLATASGLGFAVFAFFAAQLVLQVSDSITAWLFAGLAVVVAAELVGRRTRWCWQARSLQVGFVALYILTAVAVTRAILAAG